MKPKNCTTCKHAGFDGDYATIPTCDATAESDEQEAKIYKWVDAGELGDCPAHELHWIEEPGELEKFIAYAEEMDRKAEDNP